nr:hyp [Cotesia vestalis bracovirus]
MMIMDPVTCILEVLTFLQNLYDVQHELALSIFSKKYLTKPVLGQCSERFHEAELLCSLCLSTQSLPVPLSINPIKLYEILRASNLQDLRCRNS